MESRREGNELGRLPLLAGKEEKNMRDGKPKKVFRMSPVRAAVWEDRVVKDGKEDVQHTVQIDRVYLVGDEWRATNRFRLADLPKVRLVAEKAFEFIGMREEGE